MSITLSEEEWESRIAQAGTEGRALIERKLSIVKDYMVDAWNVDLDELRSILMRRYSEVEGINWSDFSTEE